MARNLLTTFLLMLSCYCIQAQTDDLKWHTDINEAYILSNKEHKPVFAFFTGSDWCGWCHKLEATVLSKPGFKQWADKNVILLELDFPRHKKLPDELAAQNGSLQRFFQVQGFPTIWLFHIAKDTAQRFNITPLGSLGYPQCPAGQEEESFLKTANGLLKKG